MALVVGRAGTGKTFALGMARHAWQLDGYRPVACAPTGIATVSLEAEGFQEVATCDRLLADLDHGREQLDSRTVLVVDEAAMLGSRKLTRLLEHAQHARAKVVLVGDDRQLSAIDAGGGFRALRHRLGASELTENRRQHQAWEREALELVRSGLVEEAVAAYRAHDRVMCAESKPAATLALLQDWWSAWQQAERDPAQDVIVLAGRRAGVDRLNTACQELLAAHGRLGPDRLQVEDLKLAVGDRVVCGKNAISQLGVANGTRGTIATLDPQARTLTIRVDGKEPREVTLPGWYLDGRGRGERNRRVDLAYATTGHRAQGMTRWRALVRLTGHEDANWLYVQLSRAQHQTTLYPVIGPEPQGPAELDLPVREAGDGYDQLAQALSRAGDQTLAIDTPSSLDLRQLSTRELRAERDRLRHLLDEAPRDQSRELARASGRRAEADDALAAHHQQRSATSGAGDASPTPARSASLGRSDGGAGGPPAGRSGARRRTGPAPPPAASGRLAGGQRPPGPRLPAGRSGVGLAGPRPRSGRRTRTTRLPPPGARPGAGVDPGTAGLAAGRRRHRGLPPQPPAHRPRPRAGPSAAPTGPADRLAARPPGDNPSSGPPAPFRPRPPTPTRPGVPPVVGRPPPAEPATNPPRKGCAAAPVGPGTGRRLAPQGGHYGQAT